MPHDTILTVVGPTASGKTVVGIRLARALGAHVLNADSRQMYQGLEIGSAAPTAAERAQVPHAFVSFLPPDASYTAGRFFRDALAWISERCAASVPVVIVGGAGLYVKTLSIGLFDEPKIDPSIRHALEEELTIRGLDALVAELARRDPETAGSIDRRNPRRVLRALELVRATGRPRSELYRQSAHPSPLVLWIAGIEWPRGMLHERIERRVDAMLAEGLVEETRRLLDAGIRRDGQAMSSVGYRESAAYLDGTISFEAMRLSIIERTRQYARRQMTWFRRQMAVRWYTVHSEAELERVDECILRDFHLSKHAKF